MEADPRAVAGRWHADMTRELDRNAVKYARAVERLVGAAPHAYVACDYRDMDSLCASTRVDLLARLGVPARYAAAAPGAKRALWRAVRELNRQAQGLAGYEPRATPTRDEIQRNIAARREQRRAGAAPPPMSMGRAFHASLCALARAAGASAWEADLAGMGADQQQAGLDAWKEMLGASPDAEELCARGDGEALAALPWPALGEAEAEALRGALRDPARREGAVGALGQIVSYCKVQAHIPTHMMGRIEDYAQKLAADITSGGTSLADLDLGKIGEDVLAGCNPEDMTALAENIGSLLPALTQLKGQLPDAVQKPPLA